MEKVDLEAGQNGAGGVSLVVDLAKVFGNCSLKESSSFCAAILRNQRPLRFGKHSVVTTADSHGDSSRIKVVGALLFRIVMEKPMTTVYVLCSEVRVRVYVDDVEMLICDQKNSWCSRAKM